MKQNPQFLKEEKLINDIFEESVEETVSQYFQYSHFSTLLRGTTKKLLAEEFEVLKERFIQSIYLSSHLAKKAFKSNRSNESRVPSHNQTMRRYRDSIGSIFPPAANLWILDGLVIENQIAGIKKLVGIDKEDGSVIDVLGSATSLSLGAENPWLVKIDHIEDHLGIRDNLGAVYHPGIRQGFAFGQLINFYPGKKAQNSLVIHAECSGAIVNTIAIESVAAYAEKNLSSKHALPLIYAVDGSWAGGYGTAREGTGFGVDQIITKRTGKRLWVKRCLPPPILENKDGFIKVIRRGLKNGELGGIYLEPDVIGDLGMIKTDSGTLKEAVTILNEAGIPIILDCVQQLGRTGGYWGENVESIFKDCRLLIVSAAKSASNGLPFGFVIMPKVIANAAYPLTQLTSNQMNGPLLRAVVVAKVLSNQKMQNWIKQKSKDIAYIAKQYNLSIGNKGLRGKYLNLGVYVGDNNNVKLVQIALLVEDGILTGALPSCIRYQPMLLEFSETNQLIAQIIFRRIQKVLRGDISPTVLEIYNQIGGKASGLAR